MKLKKCNGNRQMLLLRGHTFINKRLFFLYVLVEHDPPKFLFLFFPVKDGPTKLLQRLTTSVSKNP